jgi:hypothetical protein
MTLKNLTLKFCHQPSETFVVHEYSQRISWCHQCIDTQVKFEAINQQRLVQIDLTNHSLVDFDFLQVLRQPNASTLRTLIGFYDESLVLVLSAVLDGIAKADRVNAWFKWRLEREGKMTYSAGKHQVLGKML